MAGRSRPGNGSCVRTGRQGLRPAAPTMRLAPWQDSAASRLSFEDGPLARTRPRPSSPRMNLPPSLYLFGPTWALGVGRRLDAPAALRRLLGVVG
jgi:hypothetical protein